MITKNRLFLISIIGSSVACGAIYGLLFDKLSETEMVGLSYYWVFFLATGIAGLAAKNKKNQVIIAFAYGLIALFLLWFFMESIFPML